MSHEMLIFVTEFSSLNIQRVFQQGVNIVAPGP